MMSTDPVTSLYLAYHFLACVPSNMDFGWRLNINNVGTKDDLSLSHSWAAEDEKKEMSLGTACPLKKNVARACL